MRAGVRSIEHGTWVDDETLAEMKRRGTFFVPTLAVMSPLGDPQGNSADDVALRLRTQSMMGPLRAAVRKAHALGVVDGGRHRRQLRRRRRHGPDRASRTTSRCCASIGGFTPLESITAATQNGARVLGIDARTGTIRVGLEADLVVYDGDPLADSLTFFEPRLVVSDGKIAGAEGTGL